MFLRFGGCLLCSNSDFIWDIKGKNDSVRKGMNFVFFFRREG